MGIMENKMETTIILGLSRAYQGEGRCAFALEGRAS